MPASGGAGRFVSGVPLTRKSLVTCCIITTHANELVQPLHDRMPVILKPDNYGKWLDDSELNDLHTHFPHCHSLSSTRSTSQHPRTCVALASRQWLRMSSFSQPAS